MTLDPAAFRAAGLYDPDAPDAPARLELLAWLVEQGFDVDDLVREAAGRNRLGSIAGDRVIRPGPRIALGEVAERASLKPERVQETRRAAGLPPAGPEEAVFTTRDVELFAAFEFAAAIFGDVAARQFVRVLGSSLARLAETVVSMFLVNVEQPLRADMQSEVAVAKANLEATRALDVIPDVMNILFREHVEEAIRRSEFARSGTGKYDTVHLAIGFVDLVGFTPLSRRLTASDLAAVVDEFEAKAFDLVAAYDGRVVKLIGDEVMFASLSASAACEVALGLAEGFGTESAVTPRGAVGVGPVLTRGGDYYGEVVNLASRAAELAVPYEILVSAETRDEAVGADAELRFDPAGRRMLKGFDEPVELFAVTRSPPRA